MRTRIHLPFLLFLGWVLAWAGCSNGVEGPKPSAELVTPQVVCHQAETWVLIDGAGFSPAPVDALTDDPAMALPQVTLSLMSDVDGSALTQVDTLLNPDAADPANLRVKWINGRQLSFLVDPALALARGVYDVSVRNPTGGRTLLPQAFTAVPPPTLDSALPTPICTAQYENEIVLTGAFFLQIGEALPTVNVGGVDFTPVAMEDCAPIAGPRVDVQACNTMRIQVGVDQVGVGAHAVTVTNPAPASCVSSEAVTLHIVPPPVVEEITPEPVCLEQGERALTVTGEGYLELDGVGPTVTVGGVSASVTGLDGCADIEGLAGARTCTSIAIVLADDALSAGAHAVVVTNPVTAQCASEELVELAVVPAPATLELEPQPVCTAQGENVLLLTGTGFIQIGADVPTVLIGGVPVDVATVPESCSAVPGAEDALSCTELELIVAQGDVAPGLHEVEVINPDPAGCTNLPDGQTVEDAVMLSVVPPPSITQIQPNPVCLAQTDMGVTITGTGFLSIEGEVPVVTIGGLELSDVAMLDGTCEAVPGVENVLSCTGMTGTLVQGSLDVNGGPYAVTVTNPEPAGCVSTEAVELVVAPPPDVTGITPATICSGGGLFTVTGTNLQGVSAYLLDPDGGRVDPSSISVNPEGTEAQIAFAAGLRTTTYNLHVTGAGGCSDMLASAITVNLGPVVYYLDPPVVYNGVAIRATIYGSGITALPSAVTVAPAGGGAETALTDLAWDPLRPTKILGTIPSGLDAGTYDVFVRGVGGCDSFLPEGLTVVSEATIALLDPPLNPPFGHENTNVAVNVLAKADADLLVDEVNFLATPRVYLSNTALQTAEPLRAVVFNSSSQLSAIVPPLPAGVYDLVVINPGEPPTVGFSAGAYEAMAVAPPIIVDVLPTKVNKEDDQPIVIYGQHFYNPVVTVECEDGSAPPATVDVAGSTLTELEVSVDAALVTNGAVCVVRVTNSVDGTWDEYFSLSVTTPAGNISPFRPSYVLHPELVANLGTARRAPGLAYGRATRKAQFLYTIGGDDGTPAGALDSVEVAGLGRFGEIGPWGPVENGLPAGRTLAHARSLGGFVYLLGGLDAAGVASDEIQRARILDPLEVPELVDVNLQFAALGNGLEAGSWTYVVSAVMPAGDAANPGGETLPSEAVTLYAPDVPDGVEITLTWDTMHGADTVTPAAQYRVYRTLTVNGGAGELRLLAVVAGTNAATHSFTDTNPLLFEDDTRAPLTIGQLGRWHVHGHLNTPRASYGFIEVSDYSADGQDVGCTPYWYVLGGLTDVATESAGYEVIDISGGLLGTPVEFAATGDLPARREHALWAASEGNAIETTLGACEFYLYSGSGATGPLDTPATVNTVRVAKYSGGALGQLGAFGQAMQSGSLVNYRGYGAFWSGDRAYNLGGWQAGVIVNNVMDGRWTAITEPRIQNMTSSGQNLNQARALYGFTRVGNVVYLVGGVSPMGTVLTSSEYNVR